MNKYAHTKHQAKAPHPREDFPFRVWCWTHKHPSLGRVGDTCQKMRSSQNVISA